MQPIQEHRRPQQQYHADGAQSPGNQAAILVSDLL
jgi:hypothetical protein